MGYGSDWEANLSWVVTDAHDSGAPLAEFITFAIEHWEYRAAEDKKEGDE